ncbi:MAG: ABC transporter substrate-binding protein [Planctomycetota bacterium]
MSEGRTKLSPAVIVTVLAFLIAAVFVVQQSRIESGSGNEIKIGFAGALSGPNAFLGQEITRGAEIAISEINANGGVLGQELRLVVRDDEHTPAKTIGLYRELVEREGVVAMLGATNSAAMLGVVPQVNDTYHIPVICPATDATDITENTAAAEGRPNYIFRVGMYGSGQANFMVDTALDKFGFDRIALLTWSGGWGTTGRGELLRRLAERGIEPVADETYSAEDSDFSPQLLRIRESGAEVILNYGLVADNAKIMDARQQLSNTTPYFSAWGVAGRAFADAAGSSAEGVLISTTVTIDGPQSNRRQAFIQSYKDAFQEDLKAPVFAVGAYDAIYMIAASIESTGTTDGEQLRIALEQLPDFAGLVKEFDRPPFSTERHNSMAEEDMLVTRMSNGELLLVNFDETGPFVEDSAGTAFRLNKSNMSLIQDIARQ